MKYNKIESIKYNKINKIKYNKIKCNPNFDYLKEKRNANS